MGPGGAPPPPARPGVGAFVRGTFDFLRSAALILVFFFLVRSFVVEAFKIPTSSMEGTLLAGDFLLVNKAVYGADIPGTSLHLPAFSAPHRGDVIVFHPPHDAEKHYVKRLLGLAGDTVQMRAKRLFVNGLELSEPYVRFQDPSGDAFHPGMAWQREFLADPSIAASYRPSRDNWGPIVVPPDHLFVLGDNRDNSEDSRYWGFVERDQVRGRPWFVYFSTDPTPADATGWIDHVRWGRIGGTIE